jgi:hypothetical protein
MHMNWKLGATLLALSACVACNKGSSAQTKDPAAPAVEPVAEITVVGCVKPSDQSAAGPSGTTDTKYMLTDARSSKAGAPTGTSGSTSAPASNTYRLDDGKETTIAPEVGHQVEIVAVAPEPDPATKAPKLKVETIKMIAVPCP